MGYNTNLTILNDGLEYLESYPDEFVKQIRTHLHESGSFGVGNHANPVYAQSTMHADVSQIIIMGGNFSTRVFHSADPHLRSHHRPDVQLDILRAWANKLGYAVVPRDPR
jgi:hypothetical protein